jgi:RNA polymerase sigma factor (sigma-70 family)
VALQPFELVVGEHGPLVMRVCAAIVGPVDAEDAWSETFLAAMRAYPELRPDSNVRGWLTTIAHNKAVDLVRRRSRAPIPTAEVPEHAAVDASPEPDEELRRALNALPAKQRGAVIYRHLAGLSYAEVAELLDSNETAARRSVADGLAALRHAHRTRAAEEAPT